MATRVIPWKYRAPWERRNRLVRLSGGEGECLVLIVRTHTSVADISGPTNVSRNAGITVNPNGAIQVQLPK